MTICPDEAQDVPVLDIAEWAMASSLYVVYSQAIDRVIIGVCRRRRLRRDEAGDFAQDVRVYLLVDKERVLRLFAGRSALETYLYRVIDRECVRWKRREERRTARLFAQTCLVEPADSLPCECGRPLQALMECADDQMECRRRAILAQAVLRLDVQSRRLIILRFERGLDVEARGRVLCLTPKAVYRRLERVVCRLQRDVSHVCGGSRAGLGVGR